MNAPKTFYLRISGTEVLQVEIQSVEKKASGQVDDYWLKDRHIQEIVQLVHGPVASYLEAKKCKQTTNKQKDAGETQIITGSSVRFGYIFKTKHCNQTCLFEEVSKHQLENNLRSFHVLKDKLVVYAQPLVTGSPKLSQLMKVMNVKRQSTGQVMSISSYFQKKQSQNAPLQTGLQTSNNTQSCSEEKSASQSVPIPESLLPQTPSSSRSIDNESEGHSVPTLNESPPSEGKRTKIKSILNRGEIGKNRRLRRRKDIDKVDESKNSYDIIKANPKVMAFELSEDSDKSVELTVASKDVIKNSLKNVRITPCASPLVRGSSSESYQIGNVHVRPVDNDCVTIGKDTEEIGDAVTLISVEQMVQIQKETNVQSVKVFDTYSGHAVSIEEHSGTVTESENQSSTTFESGDQSGTTIESEDQSGTTVDSEDQSGSITESEYHSGPVLDSKYLTGTVPVTKSENQSSSTLNSETHSATTKDSEDQSGTITDSEFHSGPVLDPEYRSGPVLDGGDQSGAAIDSENQSGTIVDSEHQSGPVVDSGDQSDTTGTENATQSEPHSDSSNEMNDLPSASFCTRKRRSSAIDIVKLKAFLKPYEADVDTDSPTASPKFKNRKAVKNRSVDDCDHSEDNNLDADKKGKHIEINKENVRLNEKVDILQKENSSLVNKSRLKRKFPKFSDSDSEESLPDKRMRTKPSTSGQKFVSLENMKTSSRKLHISNSFFTGEGGKAQPSLSFFMSNKKSNENVKQSKLEALKISIDGNGDDDDIEDLDCELMKELSDIPKFKNEADVGLRKEINNLSCITKLNEEHLQYLIRVNEAYLRDIFEGSVLCTRHEEYKKGGNKRRDLNFKSRLGQYTEEQVDTVMESLMKIFCKRHHKYLDYIMKVLLPEMLIKLHMDVHGTSHIESEKRLAPRQMSTP